MKKHIRYFLVFTLCASLFHSCAPDDNTDIPQPVTDPRDKFVGSWLCTETSTQSGITAFTVGISLDPANSSQIRLDNFYQFGTGKKIYGIVTNNSVTIGQQTVDGKTISGSGNISNNDTKINWNYSVNDGADIDNCTAVFTK